MPHNPTSGWEDLGRSIRDAVDDAINSRDFQTLSDSIRRMVNDTRPKTVDAVTEPPKLRPQDTKKLYAGTTLRSIGAVISVLAGFPLAVTGLVLLIAAASIFYFTLPEMIVMSFILSLTAGGVWLIGSGFRSLAMLGRFKTYRRILGDATHCPINALADGAGKRLAFVKKDLRRMIQKGLFRQGHLNKEETHLLTSHESYRYFEQSRLRLENQRRQQAAEAAAAAAAAPTRSDNVSPEVRQVLDRGNSFIAQLRQCNEDIPDEKISEKISRIELLVQRIFRRAAEHPEVIPDLQKLMDHYLPMTIKLLNAYAEMDAQPVQGQTILAAKQEIAQTLDTLNTAFEKILDDLFADTAMDVSTDISVLNALLAQEGLTGDTLPSIGSTGVEE